MRDSASLRHHVLSRLAFLLLGPGAIAASAIADWPSDPATPLPMGIVQGLTNTGPELATTPDGAVWTAWVEKECFGALRVQRAAPDGTLLAPGALSLDVRNDCLARDALLAPCADGSVVVCGVGLSTAVTPVRRIAADGTEMWTNGEADADVGGQIVGGLLGLPGGDALVAWHEGFVVRVGRYAPDGHRAWAAPAEVASPSSSNKKIFALVPDGADGAYVFWSQPTSYTDTIDVARVAGDGRVAWREPLRIVPATPGSSRHTPPAAIADGAGGAYLVWTHGFEQSSTPAPIYVERIGADGVRLLPAQTVRVSTSAARQFDAAPAIDAASGDLLVAWRDGLAAPNDLRAQRLSGAGARLWGDTGVSVASFGASGSSRFDALWTGAMLDVAVADNSVAAGEPRVAMHRVAGDGTAGGPAWPLSGSDAVGRVRVVRLAGASAVAWNDDGPSFNDEVMAQRVNDDGTLGDASVPGDLDGDAVVGFGDLLILLGAWGPCGDPCPADFDGDGSVGLSDLLVVLANWSAP